jgi:hypothetical protein
MVACAQQPSYMQMCGLGGSLSRPAQGELKFLLEKYLQQREPASDLNPPTSTFQVAGIIGMNTSHPA